MGYGSTCFNLQSPTLYSDTSPPPSVPELQRRKLHSKKQRLETGFSLHGLKV
jgi:hypothetical protein